MSIGINAYVRVTGGIHRKKEGRISHDEMLKVGRRLRLVNPADGQVVCWCEVDDVEVIDYPRHLQRIDWEDVP